MSPADISSFASQLLSDGQALEARGTPESLAAAVRCYEQAITTLRALPLANLDVRHRLALAAMNRGNALQRQNNPPALAAAITAYDEAIAFFRTLPLDAHPDTRNSLGAAWMNRGHALFTRGDPASLVEAVRSQGEAIAMLRTLPLEAAPPYRLNLAAALLNLSNALLALDEDQAADEAARESVTMTALAERTDPAFADVGLKARRARCEAIGRLLVRSTRHGEPTESLADEASDLVDDGLALARQWESRGLTHFRFIATRLFRFGAQLYRIHLPDFLAEFLLEHIDPDRSSGAMSGTEEFYLAAADSLSQARLDLETRQQIFLDTPETAELLERLHSLRTAEARLAQLRARYLAPA